MTRLGARRMLFGGASGDLMRAASSSAARMPITSLGWAMTVRRGSKQSAHSKSSKPISARSSGTRRPASCTAFITPMVARLLPAAMAVGRSFNAKSFAAEQRASSLVALPSCINVLSISIPCFFSART